MPVPTPLRGSYCRLPCALFALPSGQSPWDPVPRLRLVPDQFKVWVLHVAALALRPAALVPWGRICGPPGHPERDLYEEARATRAALELGLAQIRSSLRRLRTEQESVPALLGELVAAVGKLPTAAAPAVAPTQGDGRREGEDGEVGAAYGA
ncbi:hypothetical protein VC83_03768 [Pseudogymnoascus destructans]|uniref:Uncharacterized protein n=1 Tax=Pseudogymnoascus destructans TaxID=655981 RepID=A0A177AEI3_9PEZI|nr:uncharacterized protein VC83_03768 [Pseudogymnoascus destructans]OAF59671.1 hypothetical protein VC83_03768 [Pseudogymnoascus destructans]